MSTDYESPTRSPSTVGYLPWTLQRLSALALVVLLAIHVGVQVYPQYGFVTVYELGIYQALLDITLGIVLLHAVLGVRATTIESALPERTKAGIVWIVTLLAVGLFVYRLAG